MKQMQPSRCSAPMRAEAQMSSPYFFSTLADEARARLDHVDIVKSNDERITIVRSANDSAWLDSAQLHPPLPADHPLHVGSNWTVPAPIRSVEAEHPWLPVLYVAAGAIAFVVSALAPYWVQP